MQKGGLGSKWLRSITFFGHSFVAWTQTWTHFGRAIGSAESSGLRPPGELSNHWLTNLTSPCSDGLPDSLERGIVAEVNIQMAVELAVDDFGVATTSQLVTFVETVPGEIDAGRL